LTQNPVFDFPASYTDFGRSMIDLAAPGGDYVCVEGYPFDMVLSTCPGHPITLLPEPVWHRRM